MALAANGYLICEAGVWRWTDKILPAMVENHLWSSEGECFEDTFQAEISALAERVLTHVPMHFRATLSDQSKMEVSEELLFPSKGLSDWLNPHRGLGEWLDKGRDPELSEVRFSSHWRKEIVAQVVRKLNSN